MDVKQMKITNMPVEFQDARKVLQAIEKAGYEAYFVGGCVRDTLLGKKIHDIDIATSAYPAEVKQIFKKTVDTGIEHGTVMALFDGHSYEITTFRTESGYQDFRRPDKVTFVRSLKEDLMRRDFTINALALKEDGQVIDVFDGIKDLNHHLIKAVGQAHERFHEDALRMMRAVRFASQLNFAIESNTLKAIEENNYLLAKISVERIQVEFEKLMLGQKPTQGFQMMLETGLSEFCPGFNQQIEKLKIMLQYNLSQLNDDVEVWSLIAQTLGLTDNQINKFLKSWKLSNDLIKNVRATLSVLADNDNNREILFEAGRKNIQRALLLNNLLDRDTPKWLALYDALQIKNIHELALNGKNLIQAGILKPGPQMGKVIKAIKLAVLNDEVANQKKELTQYVKNMVKDE